jgi:hypothetical protein
MICSGIAELIRVTRSCSLRMKRRRRRRSHSSGGGASRCCCGLVVMVVAIRCGDGFGNELDTFTSSERAMAKAVLIPNSKNGDFEVGFLRIRAWTESGSWQRHGSLHSLYRHDTSMMGG